MSGFDIKNLGNINGNPPPPPIFNGKNSKMYWNFESIKFFRIKTESILAKEFGRDFIMK